MLRKNARYMVKEDVFWLLDRDRVLYMCAASIATRLPARASYSSTQKALLELYREGRLWRERKKHNGVWRWFYGRCGLKGFEHIMHGRI